MTHIRIVPVLLTALLTGAVLFGGWFGYRHFAVEQPLAASAGIEGVTAYDPIVTDDRVTVEITLDGTVNLEEVYRNIREQAGKLPRRTRARSGSSARSGTRSWRRSSSALFTIAQAMENRRYADIPEAARKLEAAHSGLSVETEMDEYNVYLTLKLDGAVKYVVPPRQPAVLGVWPNA